MRENAAKGVNMAKKPYQSKKSKAPSPGNMLAQVQQMQAEMARTQAALADETVSVTAGGGAITVVISGHQRIQSIEIDPELIDPNEKEMLQDMLVAAMNQAIEQSQALSAARLEGVTGSVGGLKDMLGGLGLG
jgi:nucleoid-associated protein EbfC